MLKRFEVENFKGFKDRLVFDLQAREYEFNKNLISNGIVNKGIIYGKNGIGKSNLGIALFDIVLHLTDKERFPVQYLSNYINLDSDKSFAEFKYTFIFEDDEVIYEYKKREAYYLIEESLTINNSQVLFYNYFDKKDNFVDKSLIGNLQIELLDNKLSIIKYIYRNTPTNQDSPLYKMMIFVENMLWYRGLSDGNAYCGFSNGGTILVEGLYSSGKKEEFKKFQLVKKPRLFQLLQLVPCLCSYTSFGVLRHLTRYLFCLLMNLMLFSIMNQPKILYCD